MSFPINQETVSWNPKKKDFTHNTGKMQILMLSRRWGNTVMEVEIKQQLQL